MVQAFVQHTVNASSRRLQQRRVTGVVRRSLQRGLDGLHTLLDPRHERHQQGQQDHHGNDHDETEDDGSPPQLLVSFG